MDIILKFTTPGIVFMLTLVFGVWLSRTGKPYNGLLFNVHKLIALGTVIVTVVQLRGALSNTEIPAILLGLIVLTGLGVTALFVSGALMSMGKPDYKTLLTIHNIAPFLVAVSLAMTIYLLAGRKI